MALPRGQDIHDDVQDDCQKPFLVIFLWLYDIEWLVKTPFLGFWVKEFIENISEMIFNEIWEYFVLYPGIYPILSAKQVPYFWASMITMNSEYQKGS